ncbi:putative diguanylate cyclase/phosphodiesterase (GGDEF & EAL domains) [Vibrio nigripulchritudo SOn1]|uniref:Diguanylate cyclase/phosphodiesterase (GGDEF & EAL domains) n=1 Tax=Vibrio nigripulchritudo SOn1 TaxID=1238450 RepID=A0AAV2VK11_9VIBR|nr:putative diguanylate cyclase/phosphodiesterase (GGDEF & EAL domains) [Vibrio nigripulchritudo SOn1]
MPTLLVSLLFTFCTLTVFSQFNLENQLLAKDKISFSSTSSIAIPSFSDGWSKNGHCTPRLMESCWFSIEISEQERQHYSLYLVNRTLSNGQLFFFEDQRLLLTEDFKGFRAIQLDKPFSYDRIYLKTPNEQYALFNPILVNNAHLLGQLITRDIFVVALMTVFAVLSVFYARFKWHESKTSSVSCIVYMAALTLFYLYGYGFLPLSHVTEKGIQNVEWLSNDFWYSCYIVSVFAFFLTVYCKENSRLNPTHIVIMVGFIAAQVVALNVLKASEPNLIINMAGGALVFYHLITHKDTRYKPFIINMYAACFAVSVLIAIATYRNSEVTKYLFLLQAMFYLFHVLIITLCIYELADMRVVNFNDYGLILRKSNKDPLTGLPDVEILKDKAVFDEKQFLYFITIKNIDSINRQLGRASGNHILIKLSRELKNVARVNQGQLYRVKSSSFLLITSQTSSSRIIDLIKSNLTYSTDIKVDICFGRYETQPSDSCQTSMFKAQLCCLNAVEQDAMFKDWNDNDHFMLYSLPERKQEAKSLILSNALRLYSQRIFPLSEKANTNKFEVLCRLHYEGQNQQVIPAGQVLKVVTLHGLEQLLDKTILSKAASYLTQHERLELAVNITPKSLLDPELVRFLKTLPHSVRSRLCLELTEQDFYAMDTSFSSILQELRKSQLKIALDDFGSGFSSYATLSNDVFDFIKIDGSLVQHVEHSKFQQKMIESIVELAEINGAKVVAEFIENRHQREILEKFGVHYGQGYAVHKPQEISAVLNDLEASREAS